MSAAHAAKSNGGSGEEGKAGFGKKNMVRDLQEEFLGGGVGVEEIFVCVVARKEDREEKNEGEGGD